MRRTRPLVGTVGQVAGAVVAVAAFDCISRCYSVLICLGLRQVVKCGDLPFQTTQGIEFVAAGEFTLCAEDFAVQLIAFDVGDDFVVEADLVQVAAAVIQIVDLSAVGQDGGGTVAVEVVVVADAFGNGQVQHVVLRIAPVGFGQAVLVVFFFGRHFPLVLADDLTVAVVVEAGNAVAVGGADEVAVRVVLVSGFLNLVVIAGKGVDQPSQYIAFELGHPQRGLAVEVV